MKSTISFYRSDSEVMNDAVDRVVVEIYRRNREENKKTYLFTGVNSTSGTTTTAINVAIALSIAGWKTVLVDGDIRKATKYKRLGEKANDGLVDYLQGAVKKENIIYPTSYDNLEYIPRGNAGDSTIRLLCSPNMETLMDELHEDYDFVIIDAPSINAVSDAEIIIPKSDAVVLVVGMNNSSKKQLADAKEKLTPYIDKYIGLVVNKVSMNEYRKAIQDYDYFSRGKLEKQFERNMKGKGSKKNEKKR